MYHTFFSRSKLDECTEFFDAYNCTGEDLTFLEICCDGADHINCLLHLILICTTYGYSAIVCDVNLYICTGNNLVDRLTLLSYHITNLARVDLDLDNLRCVFANLFTWLCNRFGHNLIHDIKSCFSCSCDCFLYDRTCQTMDLNIHLDRCDTLMSTGYLEVHISEEIL